jgi:serine/threonine-protein kinase RsbW
MVLWPEEPHQGNVMSCRPDESGWHEEWIASTPEDLGRVVTAVIAAMEALEYAERERFGMRLALEEALVNAVKHGHRGDPAKQIRVRYLVTFARVLAEIEDEGPGFDPELVPDPRTPERLLEPNGRGLLLMRAYLTRVWYKGRGNCVCLCQERSPV